MLSWSGVTKMGVLGGACAMSESAPRHTAMPENKQFSCEWGSIHISGGAVRSQERNQQFTRYSWVVNEERPRGIIQVYHAFPGALLCGRR